MVFEQILVGNMSNFVYLLACEKTQEAALVDPAFDVEKLLGRAWSRGFEIKYILSTHGHYDHIGGHLEIIERTGAKVAAHRLEADMIRGKSIPVDVPVDDGDELKVGEVSVKILHTPGHTPGSICFLIEGKKLLTGDTLFVGDCGRTDLPGGSSKALYQSMEKKLKPLADSIEVYPGHDYGEKPFSTIGEEKKTNPAMNCRSLKEFDALP